jgi:hypothetical protein
MNRDASWPCLVCGQELLATTVHCQAQPDDGVMCYTHGNYGSTVYDPFEGEYLSFNICDPCLVAAGEAGRLMVTRDRRPLWAYVSVAKDRRLLSIVGSEQVERRPYKKWQRGLKGDGDRRIFDPETDAVTEDMHLNISVESMLR